MIDVGRVPPQAVEVEQQVLGAMISDKTAVAKVADLLKPESFYGAKHALIFGAIIGLFEQGHPVDMITVTDELRRRDKLEDAGGAWYISTLQSVVASAANVEHHARILAEKAILRQVIESSMAAMEAAFDPSADAFEILNSVESSVFSISQSQYQKGAEHVSDVVMRSLKRMEAVQSRGGGVTGVRSGFTKIDMLTTGWQPSDLIVVAARPSMGKTAFALSLARNAALQHPDPVPVALFSMEMSSDQLVQRLITAEAHIDAQRARSGRLTDAEWPTLTRAAAKIAGAPLFIDDTPSLTPIELRAKCRRLKAEHKIGLVIVDYLQLMRAKLGRNSNREQEIAHISQSLKAIAKELEVPVIALAQLSRAVETRGGDKRPQLSDLRESGSVEQDADLVFFIYRAEYYGFHVDEQGASTDGIAELICAKQRSGPTGLAKLAFVESIASFQNLQLSQTTFSQPPPVRNFHEPYRDDDPF